MAGYVRTQITAAGLTRLKLWGLFLEWKKYDNKLNILHKNFQCIRHTFFSFLRMYRSGRLLWKLRILSKLKLGINLKKCSKYKVSLNQAKFVVLIACSRLNSNLKLFLFCDFPIKCYKILKYKITRFVYNVKDMTSTLRLSPEKIAFLLEKFTSHFCFAEKLFTEL